MPDTETTPRWTTLWTHERAILASADQVWASAAEIARVAREDGLTTVAVLRSLRHNGLVAYRKSDVNGPGEWARTEHGDEAVRSWRGTQWEPERRGH